MDPLTSPLAAWARVRILLNTLDVTAATRAATEALEITTLGRSLHGPFSVRIFALGDMPVGWLYLDAGRDLAVINDQVWREFSGAASMTKACAQGGQGPRFLHYDRGSWTIHDQLAQAPARQEMARLMAWVAANQDDDDQDDD